jgi:hypothetical protein
MPLVGALSPLRQRRTAMLPLTICMGAPVFAVIAYALISPVRLP